MVEHNDDSNGEVIDGLYIDYGDPGKLLDFFDYHMESVEGYGMDLDGYNSEDLDSIHFYDFSGLYPSNIDNEYAKKAPSRNHNALISVETEQKEQVESVVISSNTTHRNGANSSRQNVISPETSASQSRSPISVLESNGACSSGRSLPTIFEMDIPVRARSKRGRPSNVNPWFLKPPIPCAVAKKSSNSIEGKKRPRTTELSNSPSGSLQQVMKRLPEDLTHLEKKVTTKQRHVAAKKCTHCHVTKTPQWREGPLGKHTLCNACGVRYRSGRLFPEYRPAASPTFTPCLHSNSHRKVIEMRGKAIQETVLVENPMSSLSESLPVSNLFSDSMF